MPPKRRNIGRSTANAKKLKAIRDSKTLEQREKENTTLRMRNALARLLETEEERNIRLEADRTRHAQHRESETQEGLNERLEADQRRHAQLRASETQEELNERLEADQRRHAQHRASETQEEHNERLEADQRRHTRIRESEIPVQRQNRRASNRAHMAQVRRTPRIELCGAALNYDPTINYSEHPSVQIGKMTVVCQHCRALKFKGEPPGMCCLSGKVQLPEPTLPPEPLSSLVNGETGESKEFLKNIRQYNSCFQMTSFGATAVIREDGFMPTFKVQGQVYHRSGSLLPMPDPATGASHHKFLQIYFMGGSDDQVDQRCLYNKKAKKDIVAKLQAFFDEHNELVKLFRTALERMPTDNYKVVIKADRTPTGQHPGCFNAPRIDEVAIVMADVDCAESRDIVLHRRNGRMIRIAETHRCYDALQYPILLWQGEDGYHFKLRLKNPAGQDTEKKLSSMNYYAYILMIREYVENHILKCRELFLQYSVDQYAKVEGERLLFIRLNQKKLRSEEYVHLRDAVIGDGINNVSDLGKITILPSSFTGGPRHMHEYEQDALTYVRVYGRPDLFVTFTCNPAWEEIKELLLKGQSPNHRHDITARVFKQKLKSLMNFIVKEKVFGETRAWMYSVEWQKRGLPHAHILIWLVTKLRPEQVDSFISAEIPDDSVDPELFEVVVKNMVHGPCGAFNAGSPCMADGKCTKKYPRSLITDTVTGNDGYPLYRRRSTEDGGKSVTIKVRGNDVEVDNRWIVPYSPLLSKTYKAHINVEFCHSVKCIKYICKYVNKGSDMAVFGVGNVNEVEQYQLGRYISSNEALWRIFSFAIHERYPTVVHLAVHLENGQRVYFTEENAFERALEPPATTLTAFFTLCIQDTFARTLLYSEVPTYFTWNASARKFTRRKQGKPVDGEPNLYSSDALGRVYTVHPNNAECFFLRLLLINVRGPTSFNALRTVNGQLCDTYREACQKLGLLEDDAHWDTTLRDASNTASPQQIRTLFAILLTTCYPSCPSELWDKYKDSMSEDILRRIRHAKQDPLIQFSSSMYNEALVLLEDMCLAITNKPLAKFGMPSPNRDLVNILDADLLREMNFNVQELQSFVADNLPKLVRDQRLAYDAIMAGIARQDGTLFFLDAPGGTGKTFVISLILATIRMQQEIALAIASSGIAATLLDGGRTAHSALKLPLNLQTSETPTCNISKTSGMGKILQSCKLIIWDECTMANKKALEALHRSLQDLRSDQRLFGGAVILLSGDFRQTLPVIPRSTPADQLNACLKSSPLWHHVKKLTLTTNMRVHLQNDPTAAIFSKQLLEIGNGKIAMGEAELITFPSNFCVTTSSMDELIEKVFPDVENNFRNHQWLSQRALLAAKNVDVNAINFRIMNKIPGDMKTYKSVDSLVNQDEAVNYPTEFLNSLDPSGMPPHVLSLKIGAPIMLLRNINPPRLCNGTRLAVTKLMNNVIEGTILSGKYKGESVLLPKIPLVPSDQFIEFKRLQFPVRPAFAMSINKAQGQSLQVCGLNLENPCFSHGQLYVGCSRVGKPSNLFVYTNTPNKTKNVVYPQALY